MCSKILSDTANRLRKTRKKKSSAVPLLPRLRSLPSAPKLRRKGNGCSKRVETVGVYPFCSRDGWRTFPARRNVRNLSPRNGEPLYPMKSSTRSAALCIACSALCAACLAFRRIDGLSIAPAATIETTAPAIAPVAMPETKGEIRIKDLPPFIKFIESVCPLVPQILHSKKLLVWHNRLFTIACSYYIIYLTIRL